jgi:hypothetical protein
LRCTNSITINSGFTIQNGATFLASSGSTAFLPKNKEKIPQPEQQNSANVIQPRLINRISVQKNLLTIELSLVENTQVSYRITDVSGAVLEKKDIGMLEKGNHKFSSKLLVSRICIVELKLGNRATYTRISPFSN